MAFAKKQTGTGGKENCRIEMSFRFVAMLVCFVRIRSSHTTLLHGETYKRNHPLAHCILAHQPNIKSCRTLLVVTTGNLEDVTLELITERVTDNL